jgi:hypothetical protein
MCSGSLGSKIPLSEIGSALLSGRNGKSKKKKPATGDSEANGVVAHGFAAGDCSYGSSGKKVGCEPDVTRDQAAP